MCGTHGVTVPPVDSGSSISAHSLPSLQDGRKFSICFSLSFYAFVGFNMIYAIGF